MTFEVINKLSYFDRITVLLKRLLFFAILFSLSRLVFFVFNLSAYKPIALSELFKSFFFGVRFDLAVIYYSNVVLIVLSLLPFRLANSKWFQSTIKFLFIVINILLIGFNLIDIAYFPILKSRSTWPVITMFFSEPGTSNLIFSYITGYWHVFLLLAFFIYGSIKYYPKLRKAHVPDKYRLIQNPIFLALAALLILAGGFGIARGLEGMPLRLASANDHVSPQYTSLVLNSPFSIINTYGQITLEGKKYMPDSVAEGFYSPVKKHSHSEAFDNKNVVIIILESFASEYLFGHKAEGKPFAPFLDSLIQEGLYCSNTIANSQNSRNALPAILTSIYPLQQFNYMESSYSLNKINGLPSILKSRGYNTSFFHGGHNGTMSFDKFAKAADIDNYYGNDEYQKTHGDSNYDGAWGIFDHAFFQYTAAKLSTFEQPFYSTLFSLSSHDPYLIPKHLEDKFPDGELPILKTVAYTDYALKQFFSSIKNTEWYNNTLFVIVADHTSKSALPEYSTIKNKHLIPLLFFSPTDNDLTGEYSQICQQADIMPTVLDVLRYDKAYVSFGNSIFDTAYRYSVNFRGITYSITDSVNVLSFDGANTIGLYNHQTNVASTELSDSLLDLHLKAYIQNYEYRMINNKLSDTLSISNNLSGWTTE